MEPVPSLPESHMDSSRGPPVDAAPRPLPARVPMNGGTVRLEPLHRRHAADLWQAGHGDEDGWTYLRDGPFASETAMAEWIDNAASQHDPMMWAIRPVVTGRASGWLALMDIQPAHAAIELGHIWFAPVLRRTRAATEAMALLLRHAADDLGYRRLVWKCDALNTRSRQAAERLGFRAEGVLRAHRVVKGHLRDTAMFSIVGDEWRHCAVALDRWLDPGNFAPDGTALHGLAELRGD